MTYIPSPIYSPYVQQVSITVGGSPNAFSTFTPVNLASSLLIYQGHQSSDSGGSLNYDDWAYAVLTSGSVITVTKQGNNGLGGSVTWKGALVQFLPQFVRSQGSGTISIGSGASSATATIASVNTAKTLVCFTGCSNANSANTAIQRDILPTIVLTDAVTLTAAVAHAVAAASAPLVAGYSYVEFW